jgi:superfamily II DNA helicase RecQ
MKASLAKDMLAPEGHTKLLLATPAFGMGVDCPGIRRVVHAGVPSTLEGKIVFILNSLQI